MDKIDSIEIYLAKLEQRQVDELQRLFKIVKKEVPEAEQSIAYEMPAFKFKSKPLIYFGAFKDHMSIFPTSRPIAALEKDLDEYTTGKGTLSYKLEEPFPEELLKKVIKARLNQIG